MDVICPQGRRIPHAAIVTENGEQADAARLGRGLLPQRLLEFPHTKRTVALRQRLIRPKIQQSFPLFVKASATKSATTARSIQFERFAQSRQRGFLRRSALGLQERAMGEAEFERLLDAVNAAVAPIPQEDFVTGMLALGLQPEAANDHGFAMAPVPFPDGWHAT